MRVCESWLLFRIGTNGMRHWRRAGVYTIYVFGSRKSIDPEYSSEVNLGFRSDTDTKHGSKLLRLRTNKPSLVVCLFASTKQLRMAFRKNWTYNVCFQSQRISRSPSPRYGVHISVPAPDLSTNLQALVSITLYTSLITVEYCPKVSA